MALLQSINLEHIPTSHTVHIALYRDIRNASFLHQQLLAGNTDFEYALIDASVVSTPSIPFYSCPVPALLKFCSSYHVTKQQTNGLLDHLHNPCLSSDIPRRKRSVGEQITESECTF